MTPHTDLCTVCGTAIRVHDGLCARCRKEQLYGVNEQQQQETTQWQTGK